jgi:hypothetical protein
MCISLFGNTKGLKAGRGKGLRVRELEACVGVGCRGDGGPVSRKRTYYFFL